MSTKIKDNGALLSLISTVFFSVQFPLIRLSLAYIKSSQAAVLEAAFTIVFCLLLMKFQQKKAKLVISWGCVASGLLNAAGLIFLFEGLARIHPGIVGLVGRLYFVYAMLIAYIYFQERPTKGELILLLVAILGVFLVSFQSSLTSPESAVGG
jgi:drug/metabolite transporter (DMT)-like permease